MATLKSDLYKQQNADLSTKARMGDFNGRVRSLYFEVAGAAVIATSDFVKLCKLPAKSRVVGYNFNLPDVGSTGTAKIGWAASEKLDSAGAAVEAADDDGFMAGTALTTTGGLLVKPAIADTAMLKRFEAEVDVQMVFTTATDVGNVTFKGNIEYVID